MCVVSVGVPPPLPNIPLTFCHEQKKMANEKNKGQKKKEREEVSVCGECVCAVSSSQLGGGTRWGQPPQDMLHRHDHENTSARTHARVRAQTHFHTGRVTQAGARSSNRAFV